MSFEEAIKKVCNPNEDWDFESCEIVCKEAGLLDEFNKTNDELEHIVFEAIYKLGYTYGEY